MSFFKLKSKKENESVKRHKKLRHILIRDPYIDWVIIVAVSVLVAVALILVGIYYMNFRVSSGQNNSASYAKADPLNTEDLRGVLKDFKYKELRSLELRSSYSGPSDPSK